MLEKQKIVTILIADICRSTWLYETLGDVCARKLVTDCLGILKEIAEQQQGSVIKTMGDAILSSFPTPDLCIKAAQHMQTRVASIPAKDSEGSNSMHVRIALHLGPVVRYQGDLFGDTVNVAARLADLAKPDQILISEEALKGLTQKADYLVRPIGSFKIKGRRQPLSIHEVVLNQDEMTFILEKPSAGVCPSHLLRLQYQNRVVEIDHLQSTFSVGRQHNNDLVVEGPSVSRVHALIESRTGEFVLVDRSTNGTFLKAQGGEELHLHFSECVLYGGGAFGLGQPVDANPLAKIKYECLH